MTAGSTPTFSISGSGELGTFSVDLVPTTPEKAAKSIFDQTPVWEIVAQPNWLSGRNIEAMGQLTYGVTPSGYSQKISPQPLIPGRTYFFACESTDAPVARGFFRIENGKAIPTEVNLPCQTMRDGKSITVPCVQSP